jgi:hypothetical protein
MLLSQIPFSISIVFAFIANLIVIGGGGSYNYSNTNNVVEPTALAQTTNNNITQLWIDKENNVKIIFAYNPENPTIGKPTNLLFSVQDLRTGDELKERLDARIIITNGRDIFKIINGTFAEGNFSINYAFHDSGSYQVISKLDSNDVAELASFNVFVPSSALSSSSKSFVTLMLYHITPITSSAAAIAVYLFHKKRI